MREAVGEDFLIMYRLSMLDLVAGGSNWEEIERLAQRVEHAGANIINTGIGWHEARVPTIATLVPRARGADHPDPARQASRQNARIAPPQAAAAPDR